MNYLIYIFLGLTPSVIWLLFYLRKDAHPESFTMILKIFCYGMLATLPAALIEIGFMEMTSNLFLHLFLGTALTEETLKYGVVRWKVLKSSELDEPIDLMLYMIIAGLGFAGLENILYLINFKIQAALTISLVRFVGAVFLHALCSGILGYFIALSFFNLRNKTQIFTTGLFIAVVLHGIFNYSILEMEDNFWYILLTASLLSGLVLYVFQGVNHLKRLKGLCLFLKN